MNGRIFMPDHPHDVLVQGLEAIRLTNEFIEEVQEFDQRAAGDFLDVKFYGQTITDRYRAQCATALGQELDRHAVRNATRRARLIPAAVEAHIERRLRLEPRWNKDTIDRVNVFNQGVNGTIETRNPYLYWQWDRTSIANSLNCERPWDDGRSFKLSHLIAPLGIVAGTVIGVAAVGLAARAALKWCTSPPSTTVMACCTTQSQQLPQLQLLQSAIDHKLQESTTAIASAVSTGTLSALCAIQESIRESNTLTLSMTQAVTELIKQQQSSLITAARLWIVSLLSQR